MDNSVRSASMEYTDLVTPGATRRVNPTLQSKVKGNESTDCLYVLVLDAQHLTSGVCF